MKEKIKRISLRLFAFVFILCSTFVFFYTESLYASESNSSVFIKKVSNSYTKKFCNAIGFGLSRESAMTFSLEENNQVFKNKKEFNTVDKELLAEEIAMLVIEKCGYPINLSGEKGIIEFKNYYLSKDQESLRRQKK